MSRLRSLAGEWELVRWQLRFLDSLEQLITWRFDENSLLALNEHVTLERLTIKEARRLDSLLGAEHMAALRTLEVLLAPVLADISAVSDLGRLETLSFETARKLDTLDAIADLTRLSHLGIANSGRIESLSPLRGMTDLASLYAWGTTRIVDDDLTPLLGLTTLTDLRIRPRPTYRPSVAQVEEALSIQH
jgi:internalin A